MKYTGVLRVGTDCSGIEAPIEALIQLKVPFAHKWSCEKDKFARKSIEANYKPEKMYEDITSRDHKSLPDIDLYVCGFPCQPFSNVGRRGGVEDDRSQIMNYCVNVIKHKTPTMFILENVRGFLSIENGMIFESLIKQLGDIKRKDGKREYMVFYHVFNTKDYGIPQNRERVYIIGVKESQCREKLFCIPKKTKMNPLVKYIDTKNIGLNNKGTTRACRERLRTIDNMNDDYVVSTTNYGGISKGVVPTITCKNPYYLTKFSRLLSAKECIWLQGFSRDFKQVVSETQLQKQAGNAMSVNVLKSVIEQMLEMVDVD